MNICPCSRPTDQFLCNECVRDMVNDLRSVPDLINELRTTGAKLDVTGTRGGGGSSERPMGVNVGALETKGTLEHLLLAMWIRVGLTPTRNITPIHYVEGIIDCIHVLARHKSATSYREQLKREKLRGWEIVDSPKHVIRLGQCSTPDCGDDITALDGHADTSCKSCGTGYNVKETRARQKLSALGHVQHKTGTPAQLGRLFKELSVKIPTGTIYRWVSEGNLTAIGQNLKGQDVYMVSDLLDLKTKKAG